MQERLSHALSPFQYCIFHFWIRTWSKFFWLAREQLRKYVHLSLSLFSSYSSDTLWFQVNVRTCHQVGKACLAIPYQQPWRYSRDIRVHTKFEQVCFNGFAETFGFPLFSTVRLNIRTLSFPSPPHLLLTEEEFVLLDLLVSISLLFPFCTRLTNASPFFFTTAHLV